MSSETTSDDLPALVTPASNSPVSPVSSSSPSRTNRADCRMSLFSKCGCRFETPTYCTMSCATCNGDCSKTLEKGVKIRNALVFLVSDKSTVLLPSAKNRIELKSDQKKRPHVRYLVSKARSTEPLQFDNYSHIVIFDDTVDEQALLQSPAIETGLREKAIKMIGSSDANTTFLFCRKDHCLYPEKWSCGGQQCTHSKRKAVAGPSSSHSSKRAAISNTSSTNSVVTLPPIFMTSFYAAIPDIPGTSRLFNVCSSQYVSPLGCSAVVDGRTCDLYLSLVPRVPIQSLSVAPALALGQGRGTSAV